MSVALPAAALAGPACTPDKDVCVSALRTGERLEFRAESRRPCSLTLTLDVKSPAGETARATVLVPPLKTAGVLARPAERDGQPANYLFSFHSQCGEWNAHPDGAYLYGIPLAPGQSARVSQGFHGSFSHHDTANEYAVDFDVPEGTPVYAARDGVVADVIGKFERGGPNEPEDNANAVRIEHSDGTVAEYAHLRHDGAAVKPGQTVKRGELIAYSGNTGRTTGPHLHFAVHLPVDGQYRRSIPVRFETENPAVHELAEGREYRR